MPESQQTVRLYDGITLFRHLKVVNPSQHNNNNYFKLCMYTVFQQLEVCKKEEKLRYYLGQTHFQFAIKTFSPEV